MEKKIIGRYLLPGWLKTGDFEFVPFPSDIAQSLGVREGDTVEMSIRIVGRENENAVEREPEPQPEPRVEQEAAKGDTNAKRSRARR